MSGINVNKGTITLPTELSNTIISKIQEDSAIMKLAKSISLPGLGATIPVITSDPEAEWVDETGEKKVSRPGLETKTMKGYTLAVIVPFSNQFKDDATSLYSAIVERLPKALAQKFDATVFNGTAPGTGFDVLTSCTAQSISGNNNDVYKTLVAADADIAAHNGITDGFVISPQMKSVLLTATDKNDRPLFINSVAEGAVPMILGNKTTQCKACYKDDTNDVLAFAGDWTQAYYGIAKSLNISVSDQATLNDGGTTINLWQRNMFAVRAEIEIGFVADTACFNKITE